MGKLLTTTATDAAMAPADLDAELSRQILKEGTAAHFVVVSIPRFFFQDIIIYTFFGAEPASFLRVPGST